MAGLSAFSGLTVDLSGISFSSTIQQLFTDISGGVIQPGFLSTLSTVITDISGVSANFSTLVGDLSGNLVTDSFVSTLVYDLTHIQGLSTHKYSDKELADKEYILNRAHMTIDSQVDFFRNILPICTAYYQCLWQVEPPSRCSDGKRRNFGDYIDFLFPGPYLEDIIASSNTYDRPFTVELILDLKHNNGQFIITPKR
jgi:hypothetical protein